ncbi:MAG TPA: GGDEF domain-containing protein [Terriglobales bacterium]|nr:GGDEF domain-containing protein [Terriglobales bacterium]
MTFTKRNLLASLWSRPDPILAEAGIAGEFLVAKVRIAIAFLLLFIPAIDAIFFDFDRKESYVGLGLTSATLLLSLVVFFLVAREYRPAWMHFITSAFDISLVSGALVVFLFLDRPHTAVNSKVVFEGYFLAIAGTSLRYDKRVCITAGLLAFAEYLGIVYFAASHWDLNNPSYSPFVYGMFDWSNEVSRLVILLTASVLSLAVVARSQKLLHAATTDPLTGLHNRGYIDDRFANELSRARRYNKPLTVAVIDADHFKLLNDTYGHPAGDRVLQQIAATLRSSFRQSDTAGRYGGEEFVVILPETDIETAQRKLESLRETIAATSISIPPRGEKICVTVCAGLSSYPEDGEDSAALFALADDRMFQAKKEGRNRVVAGSLSVAMS